MGKLLRLRRKGTLGDESRRVAKPVRQSKRKAARVPIKIVLKPREAIVPPPTSGEGIALMDLERYHCRAIVGHGQDGLARYCGHEIVGFEFRGQVLRTSYCEHHNNVYHNRD